ncbi:hypothetical protein BH11MYX3_BH11MYX3_30430 [soil metagenome]
MIARLAGVALDGRYAMAAAGSSPARAGVARWIAANAMATSSVRIQLRGTLPRASGTFSVDAPCFAGLLAALSTVPALIDPTTIPRGWRMALAALGVPCLDRSAVAAISEGVSVFLLHRPGRVALSVGVEPGGYVVKVVSPDRLLAA